MRAKSHSLGSVQLAGQSRLTSIMCLSLHSLYSPPAATMIWKLVGAFCSHWQGHSISAQRGALPCHLPDTHVSWPFQRHILCASFLQLCHKPHQLVPPTQGLEDLSRPSRASILCPAVSCPPLTLGRAAFVPSWESLHSAQRSGRTPAVTVGCFSSFFFFFVFSTFTF